jgi:YtkA-like
MSVAANARAGFVALVGLLWLATGSPALADVKDYEFELVQSDVKSGGQVIVAVRLMNKKTGKTVPNAVIFAKRIDMAPDGMAEMKEPIEEVPSTEPGLYRFKTTIPMAGRWQLSLGAKVQGETGTVESKLVLKATP